MAIDWREVVRLNVQRIVQAATSIDAEMPVCVLAELVNARDHLGASGLLQLIAETKLQNAIHLIDPADGKRRLACLPIDFDRLLTILEQYEDVDELRKRIKTGGTLVLWAICFNADKRELLDIHIASPEHN